MPKVTLQDALRYIMIGFALIAYHYYWDADQTKKIISDLTIVGISAISLAAGSLIYILYRGVIYPLILKAQDALREKDNPNYRIYLRNRFSITMEESRRLYVFIVNKKLSDKLETYQPMFSGIHYVYMVGLIGIVYSCGGFFADMHNWWHYLVFGGGIFWGGFIADRRVETEEYLLIKTLPASEIDKLKIELLDIKV